MSKQWWCVVLAVVLASCSPVKTSVFPVANHAGEPVLLDPSRFKITESTRDSDMIRLLEDVVRAMPDNFPSNLVKLDPDRGEQVQGVLLMRKVEVREKTKKKDTGMVLPLVVIKHIHVPQERIDAAMQPIQRAYCSELRKHGRLVPMSRIESRPDAAP